MLAIPLLALLALSVSVSYVGWNLWRVYTQSYSYSDYERRLVNDTLYSANNHNHRSSNTLSTADIAIIDRAVHDLVATIRRHRTLDVTAWFGFFATDCTTRIEQCHPHRFETRRRDPLSAIEFWLFQSPTAQLRRQRHHPDNNNPMHLLAGQASTSSIIAAQADSTCRIFASAMNSIVKHPGHEPIDTLRLEIDRSPPPPRLQRYLDAFLKESIRWSSSPLPAATVIPENGLATKQDCGIFGVDVASFRPGRWLDAPGERRRAMEDAFLAFAPGTSWEMGWELVKKAVVAILWNFEMRVVGTTLEEAAEDPRQSVLITFSERER